MSAPRLLLELGVGGGRLALDDHAGNIVGFIVGFTGYYIIDALTGEQVEQGVRQGLQGTTGGSR